MKRIDVDDYTLLFVAYRDHKHRWAVPSHYTVAMMATRVADMTDAEHKHRRKGDTEFEVLDEDGATVLPKSFVSAQLVDGEHVTIIRKERRR